MTDLILKLNRKFTKSEKQECVPTILRLIDIANLARMQGLLALEAEIEHEENIFLKFAINLVVDGTDPTLVKQILQNLILADEYSGAELLSRILMIEGVLSIQNGENPRIIMLKLSAMLGEEFVLQMSEELFSVEGKIQKNRRFYNAVRDDKALPESEIFESILLNFDNRSIQWVLREVNEFFHIAAALSGCSGRLKRKVFDNVSLSVGLMLGEFWESSKPEKEYILKCQNNILQIIEKLKKNGEII